MRNSIASFASRSRGLISRHIAAISPSQSSPSNRNTTGGQAEERLWQGKVRLVADGDEIEALCYAFHKNKGDTTIVRFPKHVTLDAFSKRAGPMPPVAGMSYFKLEPTCVTKSGPDYNRILLKIIQKNCFYQLPCTSENGELGILNVYAEQNLHVQQGSERQGIEAVFTSEA